MEYGVRVATHSNGGRSTWRRAIAGRMQGGWARYRTRSYSISACGRPFTQETPAPGGSHCSVCVLTHKNQQVNCLNRLSVDNQANCRMELGTSCLQLRVEQGKEILRLEGRARKGDLKASPSVLAAGADSLELLEAEPVCDSSAPFPVLPLGPLRSMSP